jgi:hypothetical protein
MRIDPIAPSQDHRPTEPRMGHAELFFVSANKSRRPGMQWSEDDYDVREGLPKETMV